MESLACFMNVFSFPLNEGGFPSVCSTVHPIWLLVVVKLGPSLKDLFWPYNFFLNFALKTTVKMSKLLEVWEFKFQFGQNLTTTRSQIGYAVCSAYIDSSPFCGLSGLSKGQIISECPYEITVCPKIATQKFQRGQIKKIKSLYYTN